MSEMIEHKGIIREIGPQGMRISILAESACGSCQAKGICGMSESGEREVELKQWEGLYHEGEEVNIVFREALGMKALFYGYVLPFILVVGSLAALTAADLGELQAGLLSLGMLVPYYLVLYLFRHSLEKTFHLTVEKLT